MIFLEKIEDLDRFPENKQLILQVSLNKRKFEISLNNVTQKNGDVNVLKVFYFFCHPNKSMKSYF
jgi:hypothetical protein